MINRSSKKNTPFRKRSLCIAISSALTASMAVDAQDRGLEEIIVTSTKRELNLQDTPLAVTALGNEELTLLRLKNFEDYVGQIPSLAVTEREPGASSVIMRGCAAQGLSFSDSATTSVYLDEQPITAAGYNPDPRLIDIERLEALAGPQGTLFGDAAQCGTLRIITNKPNTTEFSGWLDVTGSSIKDGGDSRDVSAMFNIPLLDNKLALRFVGFSSDEAGWVDNILSPSPGKTFDNAAYVDDDVNSSTWQGGRVGLRWAASDQWTVDLQHIYQKYELDGFADASLNTQNYSDTSVFPVFGSREQARFSEDVWEDEWYQTALTIEGDLDIGNFVLSGAYFDRDSAYSADSTAYLQSFQQTGDYLRSLVYYDTGSIYDFGGDPRANDYDARETTSWTVEGRYATPTDGRWSGIIGGFYNHREVDELFTANVLNGFSSSGAFAYINYAGGYVGTPNSKNWYSGTYDSDLDQSALFGEVSVDLTENFTITAGGRFYNIENDYVVKNGALVGLNGAEPDCAVNYCYAPGDLGRSDESGFVPKVNLAYRAGDQLLYATYSEGFRRGGANSARPQSVYGPPTGQFASPAGTLNKYESDTIENWEIGAKTEWLDNRLRFNFSIYQMTWDNIQIQAEDPQKTLYTLGIVNFPEAEIEGAEIWANYVPNDNWQFDFTLGINDGEIPTDQMLFSGMAGEIPVAGGTRLPIVPDLKYSIHATYTFSESLFGANPYIIGRYNFTDESVNSLAGIESSSFKVPTSTHDSWGRFNLQAGLETDDWSVSVFIDNVTDEEAELFFNNRWSQQRLSVNQPRTIGVNFRYNFTN